MVIFLMMWYVLTTLSAGTAVPSGIFLPIIIVGCALGNLYYQIVGAMFEVNASIAAKYSVIGAAAMLSGATRMTYSVAVIMLETT